MPLPSDYPNSRLKGNSIVGCEVGQIGDVNLMNNWSNASAIVCTNSTLVSLGGNPPNGSTFPNEGGIFNCMVDPGYDFKGSKSASVYTAEIEDPEFPPSIPRGFPYDAYAGNPYVDLTYFVGTSPPLQYLGSDDDIIITTNNSLPFIKKSSSVWYPYGSGNDSSQFHKVFAYGGYVVKNCFAKNVNIGCYTDSYKNNSFIENNSFINVDKGLWFNLNVSTSFHNLIFKNNYIRLSEPSLSDYSVTQNSTAVWLNNLIPEAVNLKYLKNDRYDNVFIENNIFEIPVSSSLNRYVNLGPDTGSITPFPINNIGLGYMGIHILSNYRSIELNEGPTTYRNVSIKSNKFINWRTTGSSNIASDINLHAPIYTSYKPYIENTGLTDSQILDFIKNDQFSRYKVEDNTYNDSVYPSTGSLSKITVDISSNSSKRYNINTINKFDEIYIDGDLNIGGTLTNPGKSFLINHPTKINKKLQYGNVESPYHGVRLTGQSKTNKNGTKIDLPDYICKLVDNNKVNVQLTPFNCNKIFYLDKVDVENNCFYVKYDGEDPKTFFWAFTAIRKDIYNLITEV